MVPVTIRPLRPSDRPAVVALYNHYVRHSIATFDLEPVTLAERAPWFALHGRRGPYRLLVAVDADGALRGWASSSPFRPRAGYATTAETSVYCRADSLGQGLGSRLYAELFRELDGQPLERLVAGIAQPNPASVALHLRFGFRPVGTFTRVGRKFGRFWDVTWFERPLDRGAATRPPGGAGRPGSRRSRARRSPRETGR